MRSAVRVFFGEPDLVAPEEGGIQQGGIVGVENQLRVVAVDLRVVKYFHQCADISFWPAEEADRVALWEACRDVLRHWMAHGIRTFRVDNPHTKPLAFWAWLIGEIHRTDPDVVFLAEAFTAPAMMAKLAEVGFTQSYTYFTWRHAAWELREYVTELTTSPLADYMRPSFWPNTPDILDEHLRDAPPAAFALRFVLAATLVPLYGVYSGYELCENEPASDTNTEYLHSEKYELKDARLRRPRLARAAVPHRQRRSGAGTPSVWALRDVRFHHSDNDQILVYSRGHARPRPPALRRQPRPAPGPGHDGAARPRRPRPAPRRAATTCTTS